MGAKATKNSRKGGIHAIRRRNMLYTKPNVLGSTNTSGTRNRTIFILLIDTRLKIGELINLKAEDFHMNEGFL